MTDINDNFNYNFRTLNYLGSKLRLLDFLDDNIRRIAANGTGVCDLFAGSGCVSYKLSSSFHITSCDIQEYSRVICSALLNKFNVTEKELDDFFSFLDSKETGRLTSVFSPLISLEEEAIRQGRSDILTEILENGSVEVFSIEQNDSSIQETLARVNAEIRQSGLYNVDSLISRYYGGVYFSYRQAVQIDNILQGIARCIHPHNRDLFIAAALSTASDIVDTVGKHFAQPLKARDSKGHIKACVYSKALKDKTISVPPLYKEWLRNYMRLPKSSFSNHIMNGDYMECLHSLPDNVKTIYADPPYTRDHYSRFYHVLETMALRDNPEISIVKKRGEVHISNGIYRKDRHQSPFCICSKAPEAFSKMFEFAASTNRALLLSYSPYDETKKSHPRAVTMRQLIELAKEHYENVRTISAGHFSHNKLNSTEHFLEASDEAEVLIVCTNGKS